MNNTLIKGLALLDKLARQRRPMGITEIALLTGFPKSGVHRLLSALVEEGYVVRSDAAMYTPSIKLWELGSSALHGFDLRTRASVVMEDLAQAIDETVHLSVLDDYEVVYVHKVEGTVPVRSYTQIGGRAPSHCVATGKAMMAFKSRAWLDAVRTQLSSFTEHTITDSESFAREMHQVRRDGFAINQGEWQPGVNGLAAPIFDGTGGVIAAIGISGFSKHLDLSKLLAFAPSVVDAAGALAANLSEAAPHTSLLSVTNHWGSLI